MSDDLLTRMRSASSLGAAIKALDEGADEIERLRALLREIAECEEGQFVFGYDLRGRLDAAIDQASKG